MNIHGQPLDLRGSLGNAFKSVVQQSSNYYDYSGHSEVEEELGDHQYTNFQEDDDLAFQESFNDRAQNLGSKLWSSLWGRGSTDPTLPGHWYINNGEYQRAGLLHTLTPSFLRHGEEDELGNSGFFPRMGLKQRLMGCACCFLVGQLLQFLSFGSMAGVLLGRPGRFAMTYTLSNVTMLLASFFLSGPAAQCRKVKAKNRLGTLLIYILSMSATMMAVFWGPFVGRFAIIMACVVIQWVALAWYVLSFVPYGHSFGRTLLRSICSCLFRLRL